ncbi:Small-conductance mechanosensitive channel [Roseimaritima multifibrata]|uniref:Small-conductance mechanosensitive channel n=1 Tax=Roseimaritima multifibrata TaxID=1930274 RepID=A0A517MMU7_9BACT|nr:mechanosensitive ion channel domain-containing protein [Roseimaritima multifibrata]QDS96213.1 Small-conductance mechanosensitive channel [Roseimaritima multifibrata]
MIFYAFNGIANAAGSAEMTAGNMSKAGKSAGDALREGQAKFSRFFNDIQDIPFVEIVLIVVGTWAAIVFIQRAVPFVAERGPSQLRMYLLGAVPITRLILLVSATIAIVPLVFDVSVQNFFVVAGATSVAIGFAFKDYASSLIAGVVAVFERPYRPGDWVEIEGDYGEIVTVGMRALRIRTPSDDIVTIPNDNFWTSNIKNSNDGAQTLMCVADFYVRPDHDAVQVRQGLRMVAMTSCYLEFDKPVAVMLEEEPWGTHYKIKAYPFDMRDQFRFISDLTVRGKQAILHAGAMPVSGLPVPVGSDLPRTDVSGL